MKRLLLGLCGVLCSFGAVADMPQQATPQAPPGRSSADALKSQGEEVVVDVVVRDKKGRDVTDLSQSDFTVSDNGQTRPIQSFRLVRGEDELSSAAGKNTGQLDPLRPVRLVSLIFDRTDLNGRRLSRDAALDLLKESFPQNVYMAVFELDQKLEALQPFTKDRDLLRKAVEHATSGEYTQYGSDSAQVQRSLEALAGPNLAGKQSLEDQIASMPAGADSHGAPSGFEKMDQFMAEILLQMVRFDERTDLAESGRSSILGLLAAVRAQYALPGRKTMLYFSNGFSVPQGMEETFQSVISTANRFNVSFYTVDARGLSTANLNDKANSQLTGAAAASRTNGQSRPAGDNHVTVDSALSVDTALTSGRYNTQDTLAILAEETGGFLIANTNDFRGPVHKISEDISTYYEITYNPQIDKYDGSFRKISVKTGRSDLRLQSRSGYYALPMSMLSGGGLHAYEMPLLRALSATPAVLTFPFESGGLHYRSEGRDQTCEFVIDMPLKNVTLAPADASGNYAGGLSYVALVKNAAGEVVKKLQGDVPVKLSQDQVLSFHQSRFTDMEYFDVPPGRYTIETAVLDRQTGATSARRSVALVPAPAPRLSLSSVALIRSWKTRNPDAAVDDPFVLGDRSLTPTLTPGISKAASTSLPFYLVVYPDPASSEKPELTMEFTRDGKVKRVGSPPLGTPDAQGRIPTIATAAIEQFETGNYAVRFVVKQGNQVAQESLSLTLEP